MILDRCACGATKRPTSARCCFCAAELRKKPAAPTPCARCKTLVGRLYAVRGWGLVCSACRRLHAKRQRCRLACKTRLANRPKGLCWQCSMDAEVRLEFLSTSKYAPRSARGIEDAGDFAGDAAEPTPTGAPPGSEAKLAVLVGRAERREALFSAADVGWEAYSRDAG